MRKCTVRTVLNHSSALPLYILRFARTFIRDIKWTEAEQTVHLLYPIVAGIIFTAFICKKSMRVFHTLLPHIPYFRLVLGIIFLQNFP